MRRQRFPLWRRAWFWLVRHPAQINHRIQARRNVARHYDLSNELYRTFLDPHVQYSCA